MDVERAFSKGIALLRSAAARAGRAGRARERPEFWIDERTCKSCYECDVMFSLFVRKHHCRMCGRVFCGACSARSLPPVNDPEGDPVRVCTFCHDQRQGTSALVSATSAGTERMHPGGVDDNGGAIGRGHGQHGGNVGDDAREAPGSGGAGMRLSVNDRRSSRGGVGLDREPPFHGRRGLRRVALGMNENALAGARDAKGAMASPVSYLLGAEHRSSDTDDSDSEDAAGPCDGRVDGGEPCRDGGSVYASDIAAEVETTAASASSGDSGRDVQARPAPIVSPPESTHPAPDGRHVDARPRAFPGGGGSRHAMRHVVLPPAASDKMPAALLDVRKRLAAAFKSVEPSDALRRAAFSVLRDDELWRRPPPAAPPAVLAARLAARRAQLTAVNARHLRRLVRQRLLAATALTQRREGRTNQGGLRVDELDAWTELVTRLATEAADAVRPAFVAGGSMSSGYDMDPRALVKIKRIATGAPEDSRVVTRGEVFGRNVAHRRMASVVRAPRIVLLGGALEYHRVAGPRLSSLDTLLDQEHEHLRTAVMRICALAPDVLAVEKTVARFAQELLLERGVTLVLNVKPAVLARLARCTGAEIAPAPDALTEGSVGVCGEFKVERVAQTLETDARTGAPMEKTLMAFTGCPAVGLGCTVLLKGGTLAALGAVKSVLRDSILAAHHLSREAAWLAAATTGSALFHDVEMVEGEGGGISEVASVAPAASAAAVTSDLQRSWAQTFPDLSDTTPSPVLAISPHVRVTSEAMAAAAATVEPFDDSCPTARLLASSSAATSILDASKTVSLSLSSFCASRGVMCDPPNLRGATLSHYGPTDLPLGHFLHEAMTPPAERCCPNPECGAGPEDHVRTYYLCGGRVVLRVRHETETDGGPTPEAETAEMAEMEEHEGAVFWHWSRCRSCGGGRDDDGGGGGDGLGSAFGVGVGHGAFAREADRDGDRSFRRPSPPHGGRVPLPTDAMELSLGRFLELALASPYLRSGDGGDGGGAASCGHALFTDRVHFIATTTTTACFVVDPLTPLKVTPPPRTLRPPLDPGPTASSISQSCAAGGASDDPSYVVAHSLNTTDYAVQLTAARWAAVNTAVGAAAKGKRREAEEHGTALNVDAGASTTSPSRTPLVPPPASASSSTTGLDALLLPDRVHLKHCFDTERGGRHQVTAYFALQFDTLRGLILSDGNKGFVSALSCCLPWEGGAAGGKSNAYFAKSVDDRFIVKQMQRTELNSFLAEFGLAYFAHMHKTLGGCEGDGEDGECAPPRTCLARILGVYQVSSRVQNLQAEKGNGKGACGEDGDTRGGMDVGSEGGGEKIASLPESVSTASGASGGQQQYRETKLEFLVMENLFHGRSVGSSPGVDRSIVPAWRTYDLKGSLRSRYSPNIETPVLLDENLQEELATDPILVKERDKRRLEAALYWDTAFLAFHGVMDYSLLAGVDRERGQLVVGIIDYLRQYTWDKQLETYVKASGVLGGAGREPTVISPNLYKKRFRRAMSRYFVMVPTGVLGHDAAEAQERRVECRMEAGGHDGDS